MSGPRQKKKSNTKPDASFVQTRQARVFYYLNFGDLMHKTLLLDRKAWDLVLDARGNIACASEPYSIAQDAASAVKTFLGECWYDTRQGIPYWQTTLGQSPALSLVKTLIVDAAMTVPDVTAAHCTFVDLRERQLTGNLLITDADGNTATVTF